MKGTKKLLGVIKMKQILLYTPLIKWYLQHGLRLTKVLQLVEYEQGKPFSWFPEEVRNASPEADKGHLKKQLGNAAKLKRNSFYGKMIEDLSHHKSTKFIIEERLLTKPLGLLFLTV